MSAATTPGKTPYYFVPAPSRHPVMAAIGLFFVILGAGQWVNGHGWGMYSLFGGLRASAQMIIYEVSIGFILICVVVLALAFDYVNGFHDTANAVATVVSTSVLPARTAVLLAAICNFG